MLDSDINIDLSNLSAELSDLHFDGDIAEGQIKRI